jgi:hypothetical protein
MPQVVDRFEPDATAAELGVYRLVGTHFSAVAPPDYPEHHEEVRLIIRELGERFRPLWVTNIWQAPHGDRELIRRCHHVLGQYDPAPTAQKRRIRNLLLPTVRLYGIEWRQPIYCDEVLDGLTNEERSAGKVLPRYQPLDYGVIAQLRFSQWYKRKMDALALDAETREREDAAKREDKRNTETIADDRRAEWREDRLWRSHRAGAAVFLGAN